MVAEGSEWLREGGLALAFLAAIYAALLTALVAFLRTYGLPKGWRPRPRYLGKMTARALPLIGADVIERGTRLLDVFLIGQSASAATVGIYFFAKEIVSVPQKLKTSFEPILSPVITKNLKSGNMGAIAAQVRQVGFWIIALQIGIALALAIPGEAVMGLGGPAIVGGTGALAILLAAEVIASMAVVSESVLVYIARKRNLAINWHWALSYAAAAATVVGFVATFLPEWMELIFGIPAILATYGYVIWKRGFGDEDRMLFRKNIGGNR